MCERQVLALLQEINGKVTKLMSQDATIAAEATAEETSITSITTALTSIQGLLSALQGESGLSPTTLAAAAQVETNLAALATTAAGDVTADTPPAAAPPAS
jgi:hypothetical protein